MTTNPIWCYSMVKTEIPKRVVIKYADLSPTINSRVESLLTARNERFSLKSKVGKLAFSAITAAAAGTGIAKGIALEKSLPIDMPVLGVQLEILKSAHVLHWFVGSYLVTSLAKLAGYKAGSRKVRAETRMVNSTALYQRCFDEKGEHLVSDYVNTHVGHVDSDGNLHLIHKSLYERALIAAQRTFLREIVPGRYRITLKNDEGRR